MARRWSALVIGDVHAPFMLWRTVDRIVDAVKEQRPTVIVQVGDVYDMFSFARFPRTWNLLTPKQEIEQGRKHAENLWHRIHKASPRSKLVQLKGNHDDRPHKMIMQHLPAFETFLGMEELWKFDHVETISDSRDDFTWKNIVFMHGYRKHGDHVAHNKMNTVCGHSHTGGVIYYRLGKQTLWELNAGFCANPYSRPLSYTAQRKFSKWTQGYGWIDERGPRFCPLPNP